MRGTRHKHIYMMMLPLLMLAGCLLVMTGARGERGEGNPLREKARYYYLEGARYESLDSISRAYEYYKKAKAIDSTYAEALHETSLMRLLQNDEMYNGDEQIAELVGMQRPFVDEYPDDFFESNYYAYLSTQLDSVAEAKRVLRRLYKLNPNRSTILLSLAEACFRGMESDSAIYYIDRYDRLEGRSFETASKKIGIYLILKDTVGAVASVDSLIAGNPKDVSYVALKGKLYQLLEKNDSAYKYYVEAERIDPAAGGPKMALAEYYASIGDSVNYDNKIYEALLSEDLDMETKSDMMAEYLQKLMTNKENTERGDNLFEVLHKQYPYEPTVLNLSARYNAAKGKFGAAIDDIGYAIDLNPADEHMPAQKMSYQISDGKYRDAIATFRKYYGGREGVDQDIRLLYASAAGNAGDEALADSIYCGMIKEEMPDIVIGDTTTYEKYKRYLTRSDLWRVSNLFLMRGDSYYLCKNLPATYASYDDALYFYPDNVMAMNNYAYFLSENGGDLEKAEKMSRKTIDSDGDNPTYLDTYAWILHKTKRDEEALVYQQAAIEKAKGNDDESGDLYFHLGEILHSLGKDKEAKEAWNKAAELEPDNAEFKARAGVKSKAVKSKGKKKNRKKK